MNFLATPPAPYRSLPGPPGPESRKSLKRRPLRGLPAPGSKKCPKQSRNSLRSLKTVYFETPKTVSRLFRTLFGPRGRKAPGDCFETLSGFRARRARETPVRGGRGCKTFSNLGTGFLRSAGAEQQKGQQLPSTGGVHKSVSQMWPTFRVVLRSCGPATEPEKPQNPENTKKKYTKIPNPGLAPENVAVFGPFLYFFGIFPYFRGPTRGWGFCIFFCFFRDSGVFGLCSRPAGSQG